MNTDIGIFTKMQLQKCILFFHFRNWSSNLDIIFMILILQNMNQSGIFFMKS